LNTQTVDYAFIDATFFDEAELDYRPIDEIPHPLVKETIALLEAISKSSQKKGLFYPYESHQSLCLIQIVTRQNGCSIKDSILQEKGNHLTSNHCFPWLLKSFTKKSLSYFKLLI
jgi:hypothetical protein